MKCSRKGICINSCFYSSSSSSSILFLLLLLHLLFRLTPVLPEFRARVIYVPYVSLATAFSMVESRVTCHLLPQCLIHIKYLLLQIYAYDCGSRFL
jgi:hypothetical protein